jgi:hypothetical protein
MPQRLIVEADQNAITKVTFRTFLSFPVSLLEAGREIVVMAYGARREAYPRDHGIKVDGQA